MRNLTLFECLKDIKVIEKVQRAATKLVPEFRKLDYNERLKRLDLTKKKD